MTVGEGRKRSYRIRQWESGGRLLILARRNQVRVDTDYNVQIPILNSYLQGRIQNDRLKTTSHLY